MTQEFAEKLMIKADLTGNEMIDKVIGSTFGLIGFGGIIAAIIMGISKIPIVDDLFSPTQLRQTNKFVTFFKGAYDMIEPVARVAKPDWKEKLYWVDQIFDLVSLFLNKDDIKGLFSGR